MSSKVQTNLVFMNTICTLLVIIYSFCLTWHDCQDWVVPGQGVAHMTSVLTTSEKLKWVL